MAEQSRKGLAGGTGGRSQAEGTEVRQPAKGHAAEPEIRDLEEQVLLLYGRKEFLPYIDAIRSGSRSHGCGA